jgi:hypothetical protein
MICVLRCELCTWQEIMCLSMADSGLFIIILRCESESIIMQYGWTKGNRQYCFIPSTFLVIWLLWNSE